MLFADYTSIFYSESKPNTLESVLNNELKNIEIWLRCNKLGSFSIDDENGNDNATN